MPAPETIVWTDAQRSSLSRRVLASMDDAVDVIGIGGPRVGEVDALAQEQGCKRFDDLRHMLVECPATFVLIATHQGVSSDDLKAIVASGAIGFAVEPPFARHGQRVALDGPGAIVRAGAFDRSPGFLSAADPSQIVGAAGSIALAMGCPSSDASLFAQLYEAWHQVLALAAMPTQIDACLAGVNKDGSDDPRHVHGDLTAHARLPDQRSAVLQLSDRVGWIGRSMRVVAENGSWYVTDQHYTLSDGQGRLLDERDVTQPIGCSALITAGRFDEYVAAHWRQLIDRPALAKPAEADRVTQALACCEATWLSARTGEPESPERLLQLR